MGTELGNFPSIPWNVKLKSSWEKVFVFEESSSHTSLFAQASMSPNKGGGTIRNSLEEGLISTKGGGPQFFAVVLFGPFLPISRQV
jgi:hypothetical protein